MTIADIRVSQPEGYAVPTLNELSTARVRHPQRSEILKMATGNAGGLYKMSGPLADPYPDGDPGLVKVGAYADLLLVDGNPLEDLLRYAARHYQDHHEGRQDLQERPLI